MYDPISRFFNSKLGIALMFFNGCFMLLLGASTFKPNWDSDHLLKALCSVVTFSTGLFILYKCATRAKKLIAE